MERTQQAMRGILSVLLVVTLLITQTPLWAYAQNGTDPATAPPALGYSAIVAFAPLDEAVEIQAVSIGTALEDLVLPDTLAATAEGGASVAIGGVAWTPHWPYDPDASGVYSFTAVLPQGYTLAQGIQTPEITVVVGSLVAPMGFFNGIMTLSGVTPGNLQAEVEDELRALGQTISSYDYSVILELQVRNSSLDETDLDFIKNHLTGMTSLWLDSITVTWNLSELTSLVGLSNLTLSNTPIMGDLSALSGMTDLTVLSLHDTAITGDLSELSGMTDLTYLGLVGTSVTGDLSVLNNMTDLTYLNLYATDVSGDISWLGDLTDLTYLNLDSPMVSGDLSSLRDLTDLTLLDLMNTGVSGSLSWLSDMVDLEILRLNGTAATGDLSALNDMIYLSQLDLSNTSVTGELSDLADLTVLNYLNLSNTSVTGELADLDDLIALETLDLSNTLVTGELSDLTDLTGLYYLNLSNTPVTGELADLADLTGLNNLYLSNTPVTGDVADLASFTGLRVCDLYSLAITLPPIAFSGSPIAVDVPVQNGGVALTPQNLNGGSFDPLTGKVTWDVPRSDATLSYTFSEKVTAGGLSNVTFSGTVTQPYTGGIPVFPVTVNSGTGGGSYAQGDTVAITANTAPGGQRFKEWTVVSGGVTPANPQAASTTFPMPANAVEVTATYEPLPVSYYSITVQNDGNGAATANVNSAAQGTTVTLTATPNSGYRFREWQVVAGGVSVTGNSFVMPAQNVTIRAVFEAVQAQTYTVTVNGGTGGGSYAQGDTVTITANAPSGGQRFKEWTVVSGGVTLANPQAASTTFPMPANAVEVTATYEALPASHHAITVENDGNGAAWADANSAARGTTVTLSATPNSGYRFREWQVVQGGVDVSNDSFTMPNEDVIIRAVFEKIPDSGDGGGDNGGSGNGGNSGGNGGGTTGGSRSSGSSSSSGGSSSTPDSARAKTQLPASAFSWDGGRTLTIDHDSITPLGLLSVRWDGETLVRGTDYTVHQGSVILRFDEDFIAGQRDGQHTVRVEFMNHTGETAVTVGGTGAAGDAADPADNDTHNPNTGGDTHNPQTGDFGASPWWWMMALLPAAAITFGSAGLIWRRLQNNQR